MLQAALVTGSTPNKVTDFIFSVRNLSGSSMASEFTQPLTEISTRRFLCVKCGRRVRLITLSRSVSRLYRQCGILNISQPYRTPRPLTGIALLFLPVFIVCNVSFIFCVDLSAVYCLSVVLFCVLCLIVVPLPSG
jgi:hypothetical protein